MTATRSAIVCAALVLAAARGAAQDNPDPVYEGRSVSQWMKLLNDPNPDVRQFALDVVKHADRLREALPTLVGMLGDKDPAIRKDGVRGLSSLSRAWPATPALVRASRDTDQDVRAAAVELLGRIGAEGSTVVIDGK